MAIAIQTPKSLNHTAICSGNAVDNPYVIMSGGNGVEDSDESVGQTPVSKGSGRTPEDAGTERRKPEKIPGLRARQTSLRRVKNSTDILRERSVRRQQVKIESVPDGNSASRDVKATKFTVANVGNNGKIYLRSVSLRTSLAC